MKITQLPDGTWKADYYLGSKRRRPELSNRKQLEQLANKEINDWNQKRITPDAFKSSVTFKEACDKFIEQYAVPNGQQECRYQLGYVDKDGKYKHGFWQELIGPSTKLADITPELLKELRTKILETNVAPTTFIRRWGLLNSVMRESVINGYITVNPCRAVSNKVIRKKNPRSKTARQRWFKEEEMQAIYKALLAPVVGKKYANLINRAMTPEKREENMLFALIARNTGFRKENLEAMTWERHVDFSGNKIRATETKNGHDYSVPMTGAARKGLLRLWESKGKPSQGRVFREANWSRIFMRLFRDLDWNKREWTDQENAVLHSFRHTFCSHLVMKGYNERTIMELMGWTNTSELATYAHLAPNYMQSAINTIDCDYKSEGDKLLEEAKEARQ